MTGNRAAYRYAKALMETATENQQMTQVEADMRLINQSISESKEFENFLKSPVINKEVKLSTLKSIFDSVNEISSRLFNVLIENKRIDLLPQISRAIIELVDQANNVVSAEVTTATPLTPEMEEKVLDKVKELTGNQASLIKKVDEKLLGGFLLTIGDLQYDASIAGKFKSLKNTFKQNTYI